MTAAEASINLLEIAALAPVIPVIVIDDARDAGRMAEALVSGGLFTLEVTLRTPAAFDAIRAMAEVEGAVVGAGTVLTERDVAAAQEAGATFAVSPGATPALLQACEAAAFPLLPGAATATEAMTLLERGYTFQKFFPAEASGGRAALKAVGAPLPQIVFCPTGGITADTAASYLSLPNVVCVGGSWVTPNRMVEEGDWAGIQNLASKAAKLASA